MFSLIFVWTVLTRLAQLRSRGFPVDRILLPQPIAEPEPIPEPEPVAAPVPTVAQIPPKVSSPVGSESASTLRQSAASKTPKEDPKQSADQDKTKSPQIGKTEATESTGAQTENGMIEILMQMYPDADKDFVCGVLGEDPSLDDVRNLAEGMAQGGYPKSKDTEVDNASTSTASTSTTSHPGNKEKKKRGGLRSKLGKAFGGLRGSNFGGTSGPTVRPPPFSQPPTAVGGSTGDASGTGAFGPSSSVSRHEQGAQASPVADASSQASLEQMLQTQVAQSAKVNSNSIHSPETLLTSVPAELDRGETCEVIDGQSLKVFTAYRDGLTATGIRIFASQREPSSWDFLSQHTAAIEAFGGVLTQLAHVYE